MPAEKGKAEVLFVSEPILYPGGEAKAKIQAAERPIKIEGSTIALFDNLKANANVVLETLKGRLKERGVKNFIEVERSHELPLDDETLKELLNVTAAIMAVGSCGSCTYQLTINTLELEQRGIPTVQLETDIFASQCADMLKSYGAEHIPIIVIEHPIEKLSRAEVEKKALAVVEQVVEALTLPIEVAKKKYGADRWMTDEPFYPL